MTNLACGVKPAQKQRKKVVPKARGDVLEIGFGSGLNLPIYDNDRVRRVWGLEPSGGMRRLASKRLAGGCNMHRDIPALLDESGFALEDDNRSHIPGLCVLSYDYWGSARIR